MAPPKHLGFILDGNRRWARSQGLSPFEGHQKGFSTLKDIASACFEKGVGYVSAYVFSTENWKREASEVSYLMNLLLRMAKRELKFALKNDIRLRFAGRRNIISQSVLRAIEKAERETEHLTKGTLIFCLDYGGQQEMVDAARQCIVDGLSVDSITVEAISERLYAPDVPPVDMIVRTSGEQRISNFMLWRAAYSELLFIEKHWPEMTKDDVTDIIETYKKRARRFGG